MPIDNSNEGESENPKVHHPDYIIIEDGRHSYKDTEYSKDESSYLHSIHNVTKAKFPAGFRFFVFCLSIVMFLLSLVLLPFLALGVVVGLFGLYQNKELNDPMIKVWKAYRRMLVFSLGLLVATFSPPLGISMILMYLFLLGDPVDGGLMQRIITSRFNGKT